VQDLGRPGLAHLGVPRGGAADRASFGLANRLVGNAPGAACLEVTLGGLAVRAGGPVTVAVTGAAGDLRVAGRPVAPASVVAVPAGASVEVGTATAGLRWYLAVRGGLDVPAELGSRATDTLSGLGPPPVADGDVLPVGTETAGWPVVDVAPVPPPPAAGVVLGLLPGPRDARLAPASWPGCWRRPGGSHRRATASASASTGRRCGWRATGRRRARASCAAGSRCRPAGEPVMFLADHPVTGGYPVVAACRRPTSIAPPSSALGRRSASVQLPSEVAQLHTVECSSRPVRGPARGRRGARPP
jgi:biotin-dependent carboxylase-like uncharacterized protein